jgi:hypothetical protein
VTSQVKVPGSVMNSVKITLSVRGSNDFAPAVKLLFATATGKDCLAWAGL